MYDSPLLKQKYRFLNNRETRFFKNRLFVIQIFTLLMGCFLAIHVMGNDPVGLKLGVVNYNPQCQNGGKSFSENLNRSGLGFHDDLDKYNFGCELFDNLGGDEATMNLV